MWWEYIKLKIKLWHGHGHNYFNDKKFNNAIILVIRDTRNKKKENRVKMLIMTQRIACINARQVGLRHAK